MLILSNYVKNDIINKGDDHVIYNFNSNYNIINN